MKSQRGFTLIELMIVVTVIGILAAIGIPNFLRMNNHAKEGSLKANMHMVQVYAEDFAIKNDGVYPVAADAAVFEADFPKGVYPDNPWTGGPTTVLWSALPGAPGEVALVTSTTSNYVIRGYGADALVALTLQN